MSRIVGHLERMCDEACRPAGNGTHKSTERVAFIGIDKVETDKRPDTPRCNHKKNTVNKIKLHFGTMDTSKISHENGPKSVTAINKVDPVV